MARVLIINPVDERCGVFCYGKALFEIIQKSRKHNYSFHIYKDVQTLKEAANYYDLFIINWHEKLFPWLDSDLIDRLGIPVAFIGGHDCYPTFVNQAHIFDATSCNPSNEHITAIPRPVKDFWPLPDPERITIGSCGFNFFSKNFQHVATVVANSFEDALIRLHIGPHPHGDSIEHITAVIQEQLWRLGKPNIDVDISTDFLSDEDLIAFLSENTANVFLYPPFEGEQRGVSSTIDKALSSRKPFAISDSTMYRHINHEKRFLLSHFSLADIISFGTDHIEPFWAEHSEKRLLTVIDKIVGDIITIYNRL